LMDEGEAFYQLQQVALIFRPNLGGWRLDFWVLVSLALITSVLFESANPPP
jgi:hypothetical protein